MLYLILLFSATSVPPVKLMFVEHKEDHCDSLLCNVVWAGMPAGNTVCCTSDKLLHIIRDNRFVVTLPK